MGCNVEIKARATDFEAQRRKAAAMTDVAPEVLDQEDTFFRSRRGRLKLRLFGPDRGELIYYERPDASGPAESRYMILPTREPAVLRDALGKALGISGVVRKRREVYLVAGTRVHLDRVEDLGEFVELEAVLAPGESREAGLVRVRELGDALGISKEDLVECAYVDLLFGKQPE
jgi:predicted adenylyl cyclase CyaB